MLESKMELDLFRIIQEQTNNIILHAGATKVSIILTKENNEIILVITDNGKGADSSNEIKGVGLKNIRSRVELVNGMSEITSEPGKGFELKIVLPLTNPSIQ
jgi:signal transduction histidine kinase